MTIQSGIGLNASTIVTSSGSSTSNTIPVFSTGQALIDTGVSISSNSISGVETLSATTGTFSGAVTGTNLPNFTAAGQIVLGTGSGTGSLLGIGSTGQVLTVSGGAATWANASGGGGIEGPSTTIVSQIPVFSNTSGTTVTNSLATLTSAGILTIPLSTSSTPTSGIFLDGSGSQDCGFFSSTAGVITVRMGGYNNFSFATTTGMSSPNSFGGCVRSNAGSAATPVFSFATALSSGMYYASGILALSTSGVAALSINSSQKCGFGTVTSPTATIHLPAGTATAGTSTLKMTEGVLLTNPEAGSIEFDGGFLYYSTTTPTRLRIGNISGPNAAPALGGVPIWDGGTYSTLTTSPATISAAGQLGLPTGYGYGVLIGNSQLSEASVGNLVITENGTIAARFGAGIIYSTNPYSMYIESLTAGSAAAPTYSFGSDNSSGLWSDGTNVYLSKAGTNVLTVGATNTTLSNNLVTSQAVSYGTTTPGSYPYTAVATDYNILVNTTAFRTITLPSTGLTTGRTITVKDYTGTAGQYYITISSGVNIDSSTSYVINSNWGVSTFQWNGTKWVVISSSTPAPTSYASGLAKISTYTASGVTTITFSMGTAQKYKIVYSGVSAATAGNLTMTWAVGGSTVTTGYGSAAYGSTISTYTGTNFVIGAISTSGNYESYGEIDIYPGTSSPYVYASYESNATLYSSSTWSKSQTYGILGNAPLTSVNLQMASGNISSGVFTLYAYV
jgi:hypothetical protein